MIKTLKLFFLACLFTVGLKATAFAQVTDIYQKEFLEKQINQAFGTLLQAWAEERFDTLLYEFGTRKSKKLISAADFADRMNQNKWTIDLAESKIVKIELVEVTYAVLTVEISMMMKLRKQRKHKISTIMPISYEEHNRTNLWRFDLLKVLAFPYKI